MVDPSGAPGTHGHGTWRRLRRVSNADHHFLIAAVDHRDALRAEFDPTNPAAVPTSTLTRFKADVITALADRPSAVMLEPQYSVPELTVNDTVHRNVGVICALEQQGYLASNPSVGNAWMPGWTPRELARAGCDAAKLLVLYRHDRDVLTERQEELIERTVAACSDAELPIFVEPVPFDVVDERDCSEVIIAAARRLAPFGPMILKLPYPGAGRCVELDDACGSRPWALLSWGAGYEEFARQLTEACAAGCSGFMVGRALWRAALAEPTRAAALRNVVIPRFEELSAIAASGRPWSTRVSQPDIDTWPWSDRV